MDETLLRRIETNDQTLKGVHVNSTWELRQFINVVQDNSNIRTLVIQEVIVDLEVASSLSSILPRMSYLGEVMMSSCDCSNAEGLSILASALSIRDSLNFFYLLCCRIGSGGAEIIASSFGDNSTLKSLSLEGNSIGDAGAIALAPLVSGNSSIRSVVLMNNNIGVDGMSALAASLSENQSVETIKLFGNAVEPDTHFKRALYNDLSIESVIASNHTLLHTFPKHPDLEPLLELNRAGPENSVRAKIVRFLNEQPTFVLTMGIAGNLIPSYMEKIGRDCQLNAMFELIRNMPALFVTG